MKKCENCVLFEQDVHGIHCEGIPEMGCIRELQILSPEFERTLEKPKDNPVEKSYLDIITELCSSLEIDEVLPPAEKDIIMRHLQAIKCILWKYSL